MAAADAADAEEARPPPPPPFAFDAATDGVSVQHDPAKGRCLVAARDFQPGEIVLRQRPYAYALAAGARCCDFCHRPLAGRGTAAAATAATAAATPTTTALATTRQQQQPGVLRCSRCKSASYCDQACQRAAWSQWHREECAALAAVAPRSPPLTFRLAARALWRRRRESLRSSSSSSSSSSSPSWRDGGTWAEVEALRDGWADGTTSNAGPQQTPPHQQLPLPPRRKVLLAQMGALLARLYASGCGVTGPTNADDVPPLPVKYAALLLSRIALNAHALAAPECDAEPYGAALAPRCALLNHSLEPNVFQRFTRGGGGGAGSSPPEAVFVAIRAVRAGEELTVAYADVSGGGGAASAASPLAVRRAMRQAYLFDPRPEEKDGAGALAAALPLELGGVVAGEGEDDEPPVEIRALALRGEAGKRAAEAARRDPRAAALTALGGGLKGGVDICFVEGGGGGGGGDDQAGGEEEEELLTMLERGPNGGGGGGGGGGASSSSTKSPPAMVLSAVGWGPWADDSAAATALASLARRFCRAERLRARAEASAAADPRSAARALTAALRLVEEGGQEEEQEPNSMTLRLAYTQPLPMALRAALSDALFSAAVLHLSAAEQAAAWREARDGALAMERTAPSGWPALGLRLARAASLALRVAQDAQEEEQQRRGGGGARGGGAGAGAALASSALQTAIEGAALAERALGILKASHGSGWGQGASWIVRNQAAVLDELRMIAAAAGG